MKQSTTPKTMSSRLMTMKFMQRGAATAAAAAAAASFPSTPKTDDEGSAAKRRKVSHPSTPNTPGTPTAPLYDERKAIQAAMEEEDRKRQIAIEKRAAELGDAHWVMDARFVKASRAQRSRPTLNVVQVGFANIDSAAGGAGADAEEDSGEESEVAAPARFRQFNMDKKEAGAGAVDGASPECCAGEEAFTTLTMVAATG